MNLITLKNLCFPSEEDPESGEQLPFYRKQHFVISASAAGSLALIAASVYLLIPSGTKGPSTPGTEAPTTPKPTDPLPTPADKPNQPLKPNLLQEIHRGKKLKQTETRSTTLPLNNILKQIKSKPKLRKVQEKERPKAVLSAETKKPLKPLNLVSELSSRPNLRKKEEETEVHFAETPSSSAVVHSQPIPQPLALSNSITSRCKPLSKLLSTPIPVHAPPTKRFPVMKSSPMPESNPILIPFPVKKIPVASELPSGKPVKDKDIQVTQTVTEEVIEVVKVVPVPEKPVNKAMLSAISARRKDYEDEAILIVTEKAADRPSDSSSETPIVTTESTESIESTEPIVSIAPIESIEPIEPIEPMERTESFDDIVESVSSLFKVPSVAPASAPPSFLDAIKAKRKTLKPAEIIRRTSFFKMGTVYMEKALRGRAEIIAGPESDDESDKSDSDSDDDLFKTVTCAPKEKIVKSISAPVIDQFISECATTNSMLDKVRASRNRIEEEDTDKENSRTEATAEDSDNDWD